MFLHVRKAKYLTDYKVGVTFNNGRTGIADLSDASRRAKPGIRCGTFARSVEFVSAVGCRSPQTLERIVPALDFPSIKVYFLYHDHF